MKSLSIQAGHFQPGFIDILRVTKNLVDRNRLGFAHNIDGVNLSAPYTLTCFLERGFTNQGVYAVNLVNAFQSGGRVDGISHHGVIHPVP